MPFVDRHFDLGKETNPYPDTWRCDVNTGALVGALLALVGLGVCVALLFNYRDMAGVLARANIDANKRFAIRPSMTGNRIMIAVLSAIGCVAFTALVVMLVGYSFKYGRSERVRISLARAITAGLFGSAPP